MRQGSTRSAFIQRKFNANYIGRAMGEKSCKGEGTTIRERLKAHWRGNGNSEVAKYLATRRRNNLYFRWRKSEEPDIDEKEKLDKYGYDNPGQYIWNKTAGFNLLEACINMNKNKLHNAGII